jgi:hypothetical protein
VEQVLPIRKRVLEAQAESAGEAPEEQPAPPAEDDGAEA